jgi:protein TonB
VNRATSRVAAGAARRLAPALAASAAVHAVLLGVLLSARPRPRPADRVVGVEIVAPRRSSSARGATSGEANPLKAPGRAPAGTTHRLGSPARAAHGPPGADAERLTAPKVGAARVRSPLQLPTASPPAAAAPEVASSPDESGSSAAAEDRPHGPSARAGSNPGGAAGERRAGGGGEGGGGAGEGSGGPGEGVTGPRLDAIREQIGRAVLYPASARRSRLQGRVVVRFTIGRDGRVREVRVVASSGYDVLDRSAVAAILAAAPFGGIDREASITTPIVFRLE